METPRVHRSGCGYRRLSVLFSVLIFPTSNLSFAAIESLPSSSSSSDYEEDFDNYQRRTLLPQSKNRSNQVTSKVSIPSTQQQPLSTKARTRRDQSKDLKKLIQELEESDYSNYGSWGNFRQRPTVAKKSGYPQSQKNVDREDENLIYHSDNESYKKSPNNKEIDYDNDYFEIHEDDDDNEIDDRYYNDRYEGDSNHDNLADKNILNKSKHEREKNKNRKSLSNFPSREDESLNINRNENNNEDEKSVVAVDFFDLNLNSNFYNNDQQNYHDQNNNAFWSTQQEQQNQNSDNNRNINKFDKLSINNMQQHPISISSAEIALKQLELSKFIEFHTVLKITSIILLCTYLSYISVTPRSLPLINYNSAHKESLLRVLILLIWPSLLLFKINGNELNINYSIGKFLQSLTFGYPSLVIIETIASTGMRLLVLRVFEPKVFQFCPKVPAIFLPWKLSENFYFPNHVTLVLFSVFNSCFIGPVIEESFKLLFFKLIIQRKKTATTTDKSKITNKIEHEKNGKKVKENNKITNENNIKKTKISNEHSTPCFEEHSLRSYMTIMTAISLGIKVADSMRRVLLYTHSNQKHKMFFALARSFFPVQELCGALTALALAKKDLLGYKMSTIQILLPSIVLHAMANFRGMKPLHIWSSSRPWDELQLQAWNAIDAATPSELIAKTGFNLLWFTLLARTFSGLMKQYVQLYRESLIKLKSQHFQDLASHRISSDNYNNNNDNNESRRNRSYKSDLRQIMNGNSNNHIDIIESSNANSYDENENDFRRNRKSVLHNDMIEKEGNNNIHHQHHQQSQNTHQQMIRSKNDNQILAQRQPSPLSSFHPISSVAVSNNNDATSSLQNKNDYRTSRVNNYVNNNDMNNNNNRNNINNNNNNNKGENDNYDKSSNVNDSIDDNEYYDYDQNSNSIRGSNEDFYVNNYLDQVRPIPQSSRRKNFNNDNKHNGNKSKIDNYNENDDNYYQNNKSNNDNNDNNQSIENDYDDDNNNHNNKRKDSISSKNNIIRSNFNARKSGNLNRKH